MSNQNLFTIEIDKEMYFPGDLINGRVIVQVQQETRMRSIRLSVLGNSYTWASAEYFIKFTLELLNEEQTFQPGETAIPFTLRLPDDTLPQTYKVQNDYIWYRLRVQKGGGYGKRYTATKSFQIADVVDLNQQKNDLSKPFHFVREAGTRTYMERKCRGTITVTTNRTGFCPGDTIIVNVKLKNGKYEEANGITIGLIKFINIFGGSGAPITRQLIRYGEKVIARDTLLQDVPVHETMEWNQKIIEIPNNIASSLNTKYIKVRYEIVVFAHYKNDFRRVKCRVEVPIIIGRIPLGTVQKRRAVQATSYGDEQTRDIIQIPTYEDQLCKFCFLI